MTTAIAAPAASTTVTAPNLEEEDVPADPFAKCFLSRRDFAESNCMKELIRQHPAAAEAPILSDKDLCGHDQAFGRALVFKLKRLGAEAYGYITVSHLYGLQYHSPSAIWEQTIIGRCQHACAG